MDAENESTSTAGTGEKTEVVEPVRRITGDHARRVERGIALCLSGGGYRAMLFHCGALWRLNEAGVLGRLDRVSSVSGGSIIAAVLGLAWQDLKFVDGRSDLLQDLLVAPIRKMARTNVDVRSVLWGAMIPGLTISGRVAAIYDKVLFKGKTLQDLPEEGGPRFVINACNVATGALWRFSRPYMADWRVGRWCDPEVRLAVAVAASSAFPPVLSPTRLRPGRAPNEKYELAKPPYTTRVTLTDGGVYDNLGLETAYKRYGTLLVSDGGAPFSPQPRPKGDWARHVYRVLSLIDNQVRSLRKRQLIGAYKNQLRGGAYWGIGSHIADFHVNDTFNYLDPDGPDWKATRRLAAFETRLRCVPEPMQRALINWGYVICHTALEAHAAADLQRDHAITVKPAEGLPYPDG